MHFLLWCCVTVQILLWCYVQANDFCNASVPCMFAMTLWYRARSAVMQRSHACFALMLCYNECLLYCYVTMFATTLWYDARFAVVLCYCAFLWCYVVMHDLLWTYAFMHVMQWCYCMLSCCTVVLCLVVNINYFAVGSLIISWNILPGRTVYSDQVDLPI
jgi:hypothetical protein